MENNKQEENAKKMLLSLGLDINDEHLQDTPKRIVKMYKEVFSGLLQENEPKFTVFNNPDYNEMIIIQGKFSSMCSHHFLPFLGEFYFGYIPDKKICGLSKIPRVVEYFAKRPQVQERLTQQIIDYLDEKLTENKLHFSKLLFMKRVSIDNKWVEANYDGVKDVKFGSPFGYANAIVIAYIEN